MKFKVGDKVYCKKYGKGTCIGVDADNSAFTYLFSFRKDGVKVWLGKGFVEKTFEFATDKAS